MEVISEALENYKYYADQYDITGDEHDYRQRNRYGRQLIKVLENNVTPETRYKLLYKVDGVLRGIQLTPRSIDKFKEKILSGFETHREFITGSDVIDTFDIHEIDSDMQVLEVENPIRNNDGFYFRYYNKTQFDLSKYQIYTREQLDKLKENQNSDAYEHCLWYAFKQSNLVNEDQLNKLKIMLVNGNCPKSSLRPIAEKLDVQITLTEYYIGSGKSKFTYINKNTTKNKTRNNICISLFKDHYFYNDVINIHLFAAKNWNNKKFTTNKRFNEIVNHNETTNFTKYKKEYSQSALTIIKEMFDNDAFEPFKFEDHYKDVDFERTFDSDFELLENDCLLTDNNDRTVKKIKYNQNIYYADIEALVNPETNTHHGYLICWCNRDDVKYVNKKGETVEKDTPDSISVRSIQHEYGLFCVELFLEKIKDNSIVYFHNLKYDWQQLMGKVFITQGLEKDNQLYKMKVSYFKKRNIVFMDSFKMIPEKLANFSKMFKLDEVKDVMPYELYNFKNIHDFDIEIDEALKHIKEKDIEQFRKNIFDNHFDTANGTRFRHKLYATFYCEKDVKVLADGFEFFRESTLKELGLDVFNYTTISGLADDYLIKTNCYAGVYPLEGTIRAFVQESVIGGRVCTQYNKKWHVKERVQDFDAVGLYNAAMIRINGFPYGTPKILKTTNFEEIKKYNYYVVEIYIRDQDIKNYRIPLMSYYDKKEMKRVNTNDLRDMKVVVNSITLEDYITHYNIKFDIIKGVYWGNGSACSEHHKGVYLENSSEYCCNTSNSQVTKVMQDLFDKRKAYKKEKSPLQAIYKLIICSSYGKTTLRESKTNITYVYNTKANANAIKNFESKNYNLISGTEHIKHNSLECVKFYTYVNRLDHINYCHVGSLILAMSKRIMNEVIGVANENDINIFITDTDSMHILESEQPLLIEKYKEKYNRNLIGEELGQFHNDFSSSIIKKNIVSIESIFLGPKVYYDRLQGEDENGNTVYDDHIRLKGVGEHSIIATAKDQNKTVKDLYIDMLHGNEVEFDLTNGGVKFEYINGGGIRTRRKFIRKIKFENEIGVLNT